MICKYIDEVVIGRGMGLFLIAGQLNVSTVCGVLFTPLWLKLVLEWPAISASSWQQ